MNDIPPANILPARPQSVPTDLVALLRDLVEPRATADGTGNANATPPQNIEALAWASLGKLCLVDEPLAKRRASIAIRC